jgi:hypothetical protein
MRRLSFCSKRVALQPFRTIKAPLRRAFMVLVQKRCLFFNLERFNKAIDISRRNFISST